MCSLSSLHAECTKSGVTSSKMPQIGWIKIRGRLEHGVFARAFSVSGTTCRWVLFFVRESGGRELVCKPFCGRLGRRIRDFRFKSRSLTSWVVCEAGVDASIGFSITSLGQKASCRAKRLNTHRQRFRAFRISFLVVWQNGWMSNPYATRMRWWWRRILSKGHAACVWPIAQISVYCQLLQVCRKPTAASYGFVRNGPW